MKKILFNAATAMGTIMLLLLVAVMDVSADFKYDYHDHDEIVTLIEDLEAQSSLLTPDVYMLQIIGYSHQGNPIYAVKFSDDPGQEEDGEPDIVIDSGIHSNEWIAVESNINFIQYLFDVYYDDQHADHAEVVDLVNNFEIWIIPMINPDGRIRDDLAGGDPEMFWTDTTYHDGDSEGWRMNLEEVDCPAKPGGTNQGIDLNRNWSRKFWEFSDCTRTVYNGGSPLIAPEVKVLKQFINNHMVSLVYHQHSAIGAVFSNSGEVGLGGYLCEEVNTVYEKEGLFDPLLDLIVLYGGGVYGAASGQFMQGESDAGTGTFLASGYCDGSSQSGQYYNWLWYPIDCVLAPDLQSLRAIQCVFYEYPVAENYYGHTSDGKIGQYDLGDASNYFHPSSGDVTGWVIDRSVEMNKYLIKQSQYPFSPRYEADMSLKPEAPVTDLAIVGAKISEVGTGLPGCFTFNDTGRDVLESGMKRITWNVQNNGTSTRTINSEITICNLTDDPGCSSPTTDILTRIDVTPETIETLTYDYNFLDSGACRDYSVSMATGEDNEYKNDLKVFVFTVTSASDTDCDGITDGDDNCADPNGPVLGTCTGGKIGEFCRGDEWCAPDYAGICNMDPEDTYPPGGNCCGNLTECEGNFDGDQDCDGTDAAQFKTDFGRSMFVDPCTNTETCNGDFDCDVDVDGTDAALFKLDFGRSQFSNPCPSCLTAPWCTYP